MIVQIKGNVKYTITLDPSVWIFDDRKILLEDMFQEKNLKEDPNNLDNVSKRWGQEVYQQKVKPPVNKSITRFEKEKILNNSYVMPIDDFLAHAEVNNHATTVTLDTINGDVKISLNKLNGSFLFFANKGKPLKENGPIHIYFKDGSNKNSPIKGVKNIIIN